MRYSRRQIHIIAVTHTASGLFLAVVVNYLYLNWRGVPMSWGTSIEVTILFTAISYGRAWLAQTFFNWLWSDR